MNNQIELNRKFPIDNADRVTAVSLVDKNGTFLYVIYADNAIERLADLIYKPQDREVGHRKQLVHMLNWLSLTD